MGHGEFKLAEQAGPRGYFGEVALDAEQMDTNGNVEIYFDQENANRWQSGAQFGIEYVLEHISKRALFPNGGKIHIRRIKGHEVDTNNVVIAFVTANALLDSLRVEPSKRPNWDKEKGVFIFPK